MMTTRRWIREYRTETPTPIALPVLRILQEEEALRYGHSLGGQFRVRRAVRR